MQWLDNYFERKTREVAQLTSRRNALITVGKVLIGAGALFPILPFDRQPLAAPSGPGQTGEHGGPSSDPNVDTSCEYWRYCALDGFLCTCCGGSITQCPPGAEVSKVTWVGTCQNPNDGKNYLISYNDCCGVTACGRCLCNYNQGERPAYRMGVHNDVNWCMGNKVNAYHCTVAVALGVAEARPPA
ncbi:MAG: amine dehydrogenase [Gammaproteobacteria bacterium]|nr:amine dehydrogenase [Gammaproteobacteria bacterium]